MADKIHAPKVQLNIVKLIYFLSYAGYASWMSLFYVYLKEGNGFTGVEIGVVAALQQVNVIFILPVWGMLADKYGRKRIFLTALMCTIVLLYGFYISDNFWFYVVYVLVFTLFNQPLMSLIDSITLDTIEHQPHVSFGEVRLWASIGWASASWLVGILLDKTHIHLIFAIASTMLAISWAICFFLYKPVRSRKQVQGIRARTVIRLMFADKRLTAFLFVLFFFGIFSSCTHMFINIYFDAIGGSLEHIGIAFAVQALSELPFFFYGKKIIDRFGTKQMLLFTILITALRLLIYGSISNPVIAIPVGLLHGIGFGLFMVAVVDFLHRFVPEHLRSTGQSFVYVFYFGGGFAVGNFFMGWLKDQVGMQTAFTYQGVFALVLFVAAFWLVQMPTHKSKEPAIGG